MYLTYVNLEKKKDFHTFLETMKKVTQPNTEINSHTVRRIGVETVGWARSGGHVHEVYLKSNNY